MIHAYASQNNYWRHLAPIVDELRARGHPVETWAARGFQPWGARVPGDGKRPFGGPDDMLLAASWIDGRKFPRIPLIHVEHGAGQTYRDGRQEGYSGASGLAHARLFICPGEHVAGRWRAVYPAARTAVVGCPALDQHLSEGAEDVDGTGDDHDDAGDAEQGDVDRGCEHGPMVAITSHWRCGINAETMPALPGYEPALRELREADCEMIVHGHPRNLARSQDLANRFGIPFEVDPDVVLRSAQCAVRTGRGALLVADNTSLLYEAAALDIPTLSLNAPSYRRDVEHGLRFWSHVPGAQCDEVGTFIPTVERALADPPEYQALRASAAEYTYAVRDGGSARRAVDAIEELF